MPARQTVTFGVHTCGRPLPATATGMEDVSKQPHITYELLKRGYSESDVRKVLGENALRVLSATLPAPGAGSPVTGLGS